MKSSIIYLALCGGIMGGVPTAMANTVPAEQTANQAEIIVNGQVIDPEGEPLIGAAVNAGTTGIATITDIDGNFALKVPADAVLTISYVGMQQKTIRVNGQTDLGIIKMDNNATTLDQVVVVGYGTQKKVDLTGSVAIVDADEVKRVSNSNISTMLEGKVPGVTITSDGQPGADPSVRIRGIGSFGDTSPLYVIDGVPMGTTIRDFSPNDIETIQILKDASAAAIYGSRAANGVVIITTKNGSNNQPTKVEYSGYVGFDRIKKGVYKVMNSEQFGEYTRRIYADYGMEAPSGYQIGNANYIDPKVVDTDWYDECFKTGFRQNHNINISGGGNASTYNIALDYFSQKGTIEGAGPNYERYTARFNNTMDVKFIKLRTSVTYSHSDQDNMSLSNASEYVQGLYGTQYPIMAAVLLMQPTIKAYDSSTWCLDDKIAAAANYSYDSYGYGTYYDNIHGDIRVTNPLLTNNLLTRNTKVNRILLNGSAVVDFFDMFNRKNKNHSLTYTLNLSYSYTNCNDKTFIPSYIQSTTNYLAKENEKLEKDNRVYTDGLVENYITYTGNFNDEHHVNAMVGYTYERETTATQASIGTTLTEPYFLQVQNSSTTSANSYEYEHVLNSIIGRLTYDFRGKYLFSATARRDGSSRLSSDDRWDWFPSFSLGWRLDKESFLHINPQTINLLKVRASYGVIGNENIGEYQYMDLMSRGNYTYSFNNTKITGSAISNYVNTGIAWEKKKTWDVGVDLSLFNNSIEINADWYRATSEDLLYSVAVPAEAGATNETVTMNAATMRNTGLELGVTYRNYKNPLKFQISANVSHNSNKVISLGIGNEQRIDGYCYTKVGQEVGRFYGYVAEGIYQSQQEIDTRINDNGVVIVQDGAQPGDIAYKDVNNDGKITDEDRTDLGSGLPKLNFGLSFHLEWKGFDLSCSTYGATGFKVLDFVDMTLRSSYGTTNKSVDLLNAWTAENPSTTIPRSSYASTASINNDAFSQRFLQNGNYWKIANVELGYNLKDKWFHNVISNVRVYVSAQNLHTFTKYKGYNIDFAGGTFTPGYNYCSYPTPISFMFGLRLAY